MARADQAGSPLGPIAVGLAIALAAAPVLRGITAELTRTVGAVPPFRMAHCVAPSTPGCNEAERKQIAPARHEATR